MRKLSHEEIVKRQEIHAAHPHIPLTVVLNNIRSLYNVGSIFRTADGVGVEKIWLCGITGHPPQAQITKTALGAETRVPWDHARDVLSVLRTLKKKGYQIVLLEQMDESLPFQDFVPQGPVCLVVGNEIQGIGEEVVSLCDKTIEIEMAGLKNSLNVAVAFGIVAYHIRRHLKNFHS
jgi:tRNA G18 (ribose-2'-O)-methylase SpoU